MGDRPIGRLGDRRDYTVDYDRAESGQEVIGSFGRPWVARPSPMLDLHVSFKGPRLILQRRSRATIVETTPKRMNSGQFGLTRSVDLSYHSPP